MKWAIAWRHEFLTAIHPEIAQDGCQRKNKKWNRQPTCNQNHTLIIEPFRGWITGGPQNLSVPILGHRILCEIWAVPISQKKLERRVVFGHSCYSHFGSCKRKGTKTHRKFCLNRQWVGSNMKRTKTPWVKPETWLKSLRYKLHHEIHHGGHVDPATPGHNHS